MLAEKVDFGGRRMEDSSSAQHPQAPEEDPEVLGGADGVVPPREGARYGE